MTGRRLESGHDVHCYDDRLPGWRQVLRKRTAKRRFAREDRRYQKRLMKEALEDNYDTENA